MATEPLCLLILRCPEKNSVAMEDVPLSTTCKALVLTSETRDTFPFFSLFSRMFYNPKFPHSHWIFMLL